MDETFAPPLAHILMIPQSSQPHISPYMHLARMLVAHGGIECTILNYDDLLDRVAKDEPHDRIHLLGLPMDVTGCSTRPVPVMWRVYGGLHSTARIYVDKLLQDKALGKAGPTYSCVFSDLLYDWTADLASKLGVPRYVYTVVSAIYVLISATYKSLSPSIGADSEAHGTVKSWMGAPGMPRTIEWPPAYLSWLYDILLKSVSRAEGIIIITFTEIEPGPIASLRDLGYKIIPVGPVHSPAQVTKVLAPKNCDLVDNECLQWLDKQPAKSVVYVNFGTTGFDYFTLHMVHELALGLEASKARFLWVLRPPPSLKAEELDQLLPPGFEERVKDRSLVSRGWAPQLKILEHPSTAAFFMHCGWNSSLETAIRGIPFIGWGTYGDQPYNSLYLSEIIGTGVVVCPPGPGEVGPKPAEEDKDYRYDVEAAVQTMMFTEKGQSIMRRAQEMKAAAVNALKPGGLSHKALVDLVEAVSYKLALS